MSVCVQWTFTRAAQKTFYFEQEATNETATTYTLGRFGRYGKKYNRMVAGSADYPLRPSMCVAVSFRPTGTHSRIPDNLDTLQDAEAYVVECQRAAEAYRKLRRAVDDEESVITLLLRSAAVRDAAEFFTRQIRGER